MEQAGQLSESFVSHPLLLSALLVPLLSFLIAITTSEKYSWAIALLCTLTMLGATICSIIALISYWNAGAGIVRIPWIVIGGIEVTANLKIGSTTLLMLFTVNVVSFLVHMYSVGYMAGASGGRKYFAMLGFFTFAMLGIVVADNLLVIFIFWELVGFSSYILIGHYMERRKAARAATKAFLLNRIGDAGFVVGLMVLWASSGTLELERLSNGIIADQSLLTLASLCIFCGVAGKSAQFPLFSWLPDAMEGPTPVSALIHAATMVAAGVYLMTKTIFLFTPDSLHVVAVIGTVTALAGALCALYQHDIKKILAYSTISQLGLMLVSVGCGGSSAAFLHLFTHAFFKASLFLCAGSVIHSLHLAQHQAQTEFDSQDIRNMGGLSKKLPFTLIAFVMAGSSLAGIPLFAGFLSKEAIFLNLWSDAGLFSKLIFGGVVMVSFLTVLYTFRLISSIFFADATQTKNLPVSEPPLVMRIPIGILTLGTIWLAVSFSPFSISGWVYQGQQQTIPFLLTALSIAVTTLGLLTGWFYLRKKHLGNVPLFRNGFFLDNAFVASWKQAVIPASKSSTALDRRYIDGAIHLGVFSQVTAAHLIAWFDRYVIDGVVSTITTVIRWSGSLVRVFMGGKIQLYIFWALLTTIIFLIWGLN
jgi:NADH-quinone oxidoreductase subunit L